MELFTGVELVMLLHGFLATLALMSASLMIGVLVFSKELSVRNVNLLKWISVITVFSVFLLNFTGGYGYVPYREQVTGTSPRSTLLASDQPWAHEVVFESMENVSTLGPLIAVIIAYMVWYYGAEIVKQPGLKRALMILLVFGILVALAATAGGVIPTRLAAVR